MNIGVKILLVLWALSRLTDVCSCIILGNKLYATTVGGKHLVLYKMFYAIAVDATVTFLMLICIGPYLAFGGDPPNALLYPIIGVAAVCTTSFKTYSKFKVALAAIKGN